MNKPKPLRSLNCGIAFSPHYRMLPLGDIYGEVRAQVCESIRHRVDNSHANVNSLVWIQVREGVMEQLREQT